MESKLNVYKRDELFSHASARIPDANPEYAPAKKEKREYPLHRINVRYTTPARIPATASTVRKSAA